jgi:hypothetical protein
VNDVPDLTRFDLREPESLSQVADTLRQQGIVMLSGLTDRATLLRSGRSLMTISLHRDSDSEGVTTIERRFSTAIGSLSGSPTGNLCRIPMGQRLPSRRGS